MGAIVMPSTSRQQVQEDVLFHDSHYHVKRAMKKSRCNYGKNAYIYIYILKLNLEMLGLQLFSGGALAAAGPGLAVFFADAFVCAWVIFG